MHIGVVRFKYNPFGGAERIIERIIEGCYESNINFTFTIFSGQWPLGSAACVDQSRRVSRINVVNLGLSGLGRFRRHRKFFTAAKSAIESTHSLDVIQSHERMVGSDIFRAGDGVHRGWLNRVASERGRWLGRFLEADPYHRLICKNELKMARDPRTIFVANSALCRREIMEFLNVPDNRIVTIQNSIDTKKWGSILRTESARARAKRSFALDPELPCVVFSGSGFSRKGLVPLIQSVGLKRDLQLLVVGSDKSMHSYESLGEKLAPGRVSFVGGFVEIEKALEAADVFCLPSLYDSFSNSCLEALCAGIPVVTTRDCGISDYLEGGFAGHICSRHPESILKSIQYCLDNAALLSTQAYTLAQKFDHSKVISAWVDLYKHIHDSRVYK